MTYCIEQDSETEFDSVPRTNGFSVILRRVDLQDEFKPQQTFLYYQNIVKLERQLYISCLFSNIMTYLSRSSLTATA